MSLWFIYVNLVKFFCLVLTGKPGGPGGPMGPAGPGIPYREVSYKLVFLSDSIFIHYITTHTAKFRQCGSTEEWLKIFHFKSRKYLLQVNVFFFSFCCNISLYIYLYGPAALKIMICMCWGFNERLCNWLLKYNFYGFQFS